MNKLEVVRYGFLSMQVCCEKTCTDEEVEAFANHENATGIQSSWRIRKEGHEYLNGAPERQQCADHADRVHIMLDF